MLDFKKQKDHKLQTFSGNRTFAPMKMLRAKANTAIKWTTVYKKKKLNEVYKSSFERYKHIQSHEHKRSYTQDETKLRGEDLRSKSITIQNTSTRDSINKCIVIACKFLSIWWLPTVVETMNRAAEPTSIGRKTPGNPRRKEKRKIMLN